MSITPDDNKIISLVGFLTSETGLGQAVRNIAHAIEAAHIPVNYVNLEIPGKSNDEEFASKCGRYFPNRNNFTVCDLRSSGDFYRGYQHSGLGAKNYLYPFWELDRIPYALHQSIASFDEVFAPSRFIADGFANFLGKDITVIPVPVSIASTIKSNAIQEGKLHILSYLDFDSFVARKNPQGALDAFTLAFPPNKADVTLTVKVSGSNDRGGRALLEQYREKDARITVIDKTVKRQTMDAMVANCNVFLSMHRSEGFGFGPAEAMAYGKIVISTDYGGTRDFVNDQTGYPVQYKLIPVKTNEYLFGENQLWADPSVECAANYLKEIYDDYDAALLRASQGRQWMKDHHSFEAVGQIMKSAFLQRGIL